VSTDKEYLLYEKDLDCIMKLILSKNVKEEVKENITMEE
jgi:hypothetical protein